MKQNKGCDFFDDEEELKAIARRKSSAADDGLGDDSIFQPVQGENGNQTRKAPPVMEEEPPVREYRVKRSEPQAPAPEAPEVRQPVRGYPVEKSEPRAAYVPVETKPVPEAPKTAWEMPKAEQTSFAREMEMKRETPEIKQPVRETARGEYAPAMPPKAPVNSKVVRLRFFWYESRQAYSSTPYTNMPPKPAQPVREAPKPSEPVRPVYTPEPAPVAKPAYTAPVEAPAPVSRGREAAFQSSEPEYTVVPLATTDSRFLSQLLEIEKDAYGEEGMNKWDVVPFIRYGRVFGLLEGRNSVMGAVYFMRDWEAPDRAYLVNVALRRDLRGREVGTFLLRESFLLLRREGVKRVELTVDPSNQYAISVYREQMGFYENGRRRNEYGDGEDRLIMDTDLKGK